MKPLDIVRIDGLKSEYIVLKSFVDLDDMGWYRVYSKIAYLEDFQKYGIGANTRTFSDEYIKYVRGYVSE